jgi:Orsellinic acid/F9775 biosynthesis cluster protein D
MNPYATYNEEYKVLICRQHKYGVSLKSIEEHYRVKHDGISLKARQEILEYASALSLLEPKDVVIPTEIVAPIAELEVHTGHKCKFDGCAVITGTLEYANRHGRMHVWTDVKEVRSQTLNVQTFFIGNHRRYI